MSYDMIDRYLRNNLGDDDYAKYSAALDAIADDAARVAKLDEAQRWAKSVDGLTAQLREVDTRYMALLKAVADGVALQPRPMMMLTDEASRAAVAAERAAIAQWLEGQGQPGYAHEVRFRA
jgi:hypothetical protein